jgi:hypothetical protein
MGEIYSSAELVLSWIGYDNPETILAIKSIGLIYTEIRNINEKHLLSLGWLEKHPCLYEDDDEGSTNPGGNRAWNAIYQFFSLPYWTRTWILQEVILAQNLVLMSSLWHCPYMLNGGSLSLASCGDSFTLEP